MKFITKEQITGFRDYLIIHEKSPATIEKYTHDVRAFFEWLEERELSKGIMLEYKSFLIEKYKATSINSFLCSINSFFSYCECYEYRVKSIRLQTRAFAMSDSELNLTDYKKLLEVAKAKNRERLFLVMQTICATGIRVSEVKYITVEAVKTGKAYVDNKGKIRIVFLPDGLRTMLEQYMYKHRIYSGQVFVTKNGNPVNRSNIWFEMKQLCKEAGVPTCKVYPHNLRHLFARTFYSVQKDVVHLADILGHSNINTTRIYTMETV